MLASSVAYSIVSIESNTNIVGKSDVAPSMKAELKLIGKKFEQIVRVEYPNTISLQNIRENALNGILMKDLSEWVDDAKYGRQNEEVTSLSLTIGKMGINYTHKFQCAEISSDGAWGFDCSQVAGSKKDTQVLKNAMRSVRCTVMVSPDVTVCDFEMSGEADDISILFSTISGSEVAFRFFVEDTKYLSHLNLMISLRAESAERAREAFIMSEYKMLIDDLISQRPNFDRLPKEIFVASTTAPTTPEAL